VKLAGAAALALLGAAASAAPERQKLDMLAFFSGRTHAENSIKIVLRRSVPLIVDSVGRKDGRDFILIDTVREGDKPARTRKWVMRPVGPNRFTGTLSDAIGPVEIAVAGDGATIRYVMKGGLRIDQRLRLLDGGRNLSNHTTVKRFGLKVATIEGKIRKLD